MTLILTSDIYSNRDKVIYGKQGEEVKLVSVHGDVLIVEGKSGRFSVHKSKTKQQ